MERYDETVDYLYRCIPQFQMTGASAYKPGLETARELDRAFGHPHCRFRTIHVAGTNGKGSTAHTLAAILQSAGYRTGLYTSPHLVDFRERIRVNGEMISREGVVDFVDRYRGMTLECEPSFFELTTIMAFDWFARQGVDVAVIETGLGGRLDTTNIIKPELAVITNISKDHVAQLGDSLVSIAREKAGIIKPGVQVVIGESDGEVSDVFMARIDEVSDGRDEGNETIWADREQFWSSSSAGESCNRYYGTEWGDIEGELTGECQLKNAATIMGVLRLMSGRFEFSASDVKNGFGRVNELTGLAGRWMTLESGPLVVCDTGHNVGGWQYTVGRLASMARPLVMVIGFVSDKDVDHILEMMPKDAHYIFTQASIPRALGCGMLAEKASGFGLRGEIADDVKRAVSRAKELAGDTGSVFVGGSTFVVADLLK